MSVDFTEFKEQVRSSADIVDVISGYVALKKRGHNFWGCCPFHGEKTPSFAVNPEKNMFYCFGCHEGGDVFKFIMKSENCGFLDAVKLLANKYNIPIPETQKNAQELARERQLQEVVATNELATRYFQGCLLRTDHGKPALAYLAGRGIGQDIIDSFSLGYSLDSYTSLVNNLGRRNCTPDQLVKSGLALQGRDGGVYDKFRQRIMIPIKDIRGRVVGFGGRILGEGQPKYMNTGETSFFNKRYLLFGLNLALQEVRKSRQVIIVEGYMDAISLHAAGISNVVASMGTAFAVEQARLLKRLGAELVFCYDSDKAGRRAAVRATTIARAEGLKVRIATVPQGKDPDEYIRQQGKEAFLQVIKNAVEGIEFQINETIYENNVSNLAGKVETVSNLLPFLLQCKNDIEVAEHVRRLAQRLVIDEGLIMEEYRKAARKHSGQQNMPGVPAPRVQTMTTVEQQAEELLLAVLLEQPEMAEDCQEIVQRVGFVIPAHQQLFTAIVQDQVSGPINASRLTENLEDAAASVLAGIMAKQAPVGDAGRIVEDCLRQMQKGYLEKEFEKHCQLAAQYEQAGDRRCMDELAESQRIKNEIKKLYGN